MDCCALKALSNVILTTAKVLLFAVVIVCSGCQSFSNNAEMIDVSSPVEAQLLDIAEDFRIVQLDEEENSIGNITFAKVYGDDIFLLDESLRAIFHFNKDGCLLNVLNSKGRAKSEYVDIFSYAYSPEKGLLFIHSRSSKSIKVYSVADMSFRYELQIGRYLYGVEMLSDNTLLAVQSPDRTQVGTIFTIDAETGAVTEIMTGIRKDQWRYVAKSQGFHPIKDGGLALCVPGYPNRIMKCTADGLEEMAQFVMKGGTLDKKFWRMSADDAESAFHYAIRQRDYYPDYCFLPCFAIGGDSGVSSFWAITGNQISTFNLAMNLYAKGKMYKPVLPDGSLTRAVGLSAEGEYLILVRTEQIKDYLNEDVKSEHSLLFCRF